MTNGFLLTDTLRYT